MESFRNRGPLDDVADWRRLKEILANALEQPTREARRAAVQRACGDDVNLSRSAEQLLDFDTHHLDEFADFANTRLRGEDSTRLGERLGAYIIEQEIDRGGMGAVFLAKRADGHFEKEVAIKIIKRGTDTDEALRRFQLERQILARLDHPNITRLLDAGATSDGLPYFVMEYVRGTPVTQYVREQNLDLHARLAIFVKVCRAVAAAHESQTIHRDIKPRNVLVRADGEPKLLDFGIAKSLAPERGDGDATERREARLTANYAAPEQIAGQEATPQSDIYSLGALLFELITGERPGTANSQVKIPPALRPIVRRAMELDPSQRYQSANGLADDLERYLRSVAWSKPWTLAAAALVLALLVLGGVVAWHQLAGSHVARAAETSETIHSIAVLPFQALGSEGDNQLLGLGMADAIIGRVCHLEDLLVLPTVAVSRFTGSSQDAMAAAQALNVDSVLTGTVQRAENRVRVSVQLVNVKQRHAIWAEQFDQTFTDIFAIQDSIAEKVARLIRRDLPAAADERIARRAPSDPAAYEAYLRGFSFYNQRTRDGLTNAIEQFRAATEIDPGYALAFALLSDAAALQFYYHFDESAENMREARHAAERALALDSTLPEAHLALSQVQTNEKQTKLARESLERAIHLNPNFALARQRYAWRLLGDGQLAAALAQMRRAQELDPLSATNSTALGIMLVFAHDYEGAFYFCERAAELNPNEPFIEGNLGEVYRLQGKYADALRCFHRMIEISPAIEGDALAAIAATNFIAGKADEALAVLPKIMQLARDEKVTPYAMIVLFAAQGENDRAFEWMETTFSKAQAQPGLLAFDPALDPIRSDPRFAEILRAHGQAELLDHVAY